MNRTRSNLLELKRRKEAGETLYPGEERDLLKFLEKELQRATHPSARTDPSGSSAPVRGQEGDESSPQTTSSGSASPGGDQPSDPGSAPGSSPSGPQAPSSSPLVNPESLTEDLIQGASAPTPGRQAPASPEPPKTRSRRAAPVSRVGPTDAERKMERCRRSGYQACDGLILAGITFVGPHCNYLPPEKDPKTLQVVYDEKYEMREAFADMFEEYGWDTVPSWMKVMMVTGSYVVSRARMPQTQAFIEKKIKQGFWKNIVDKFKPKVSPPAAPPTSSGTPPAAPPPEASPSGPRPPLVVS